jgi:hypothetical protein
LLLTSIPTESHADEVRAPVDASERARFVTERYRLRSPFDDPRFVAPDQPPQRNTLLAFGEVAAINVVMWQYSYWAGKDYAKISGDSIVDNFQKGWIIDTDPFWTNHFGHPYEGASFYTAARSTGHGPYTSLGVTYLGSLFWERFMEVQSPSVNDQVTTAFGGSVLGEAMYRMYRLVVDGGGPDPSGWRRLGAFAISPVSGVNHAFVGPRYNGRSLLPPSWMGELQLGMVIGGQVEDVEAGERKRDAGPWANVRAHVMYGVPGDPDLRLKRPFDHFDARFGISFTDQEQPTASMLLRGLVVGDELGPSEAPLGFWGLFSSYDVIAVPLFDVAGFGLGPGVSLRQRWGAFELHGTALVEFLPWAGGGAVEKFFDRDYHFGPGGKAVLDLRGLVGDRVIVDLIGRGYVISGAYATGSSEDIAWGSAAVTSRIVRSHGASISVDWTNRRARSSGNPDVAQRGAMVMAHYTLLQGW